MGFKPFFNVEHEAFLHRTNPIHSQHSRPQSIEICLAKKGETYSA